nr:hypothetical protein [Streptomyces hirsutus]
MIDVVGLRGHLLCLHQVSGDVDPGDDGAQANIGGVLVPPDDVAADHAALLLVAGVVGAVQREVTQGGELGLDAVQPGAVGRGVGELDVVSSGPVTDAGVLLRGQVREKSSSPIAMRISGG